MPMRLDKAIEIMSCREIPLKTAEDHDFFDAVKIGIDGLKLIKKERKSPLRWFNSLLPGETED